MGRKNDDEKVTVVEQGVYPVPDIPIKDLLDAIPFVTPSSFLLNFYPNFLSVLTAFSVLH